MKSMAQLPFASFMRRALPLTMLSTALVTLSFFQTTMPAFASDPVVCLNTTKGPIYIRVFVGMVPNTGGAFLDLVQRGFYSGSAFHRVESWCIQGGGPNGNPNGVFVHPESGQVRRLRLEINRNLSHSGPGVVAMARTQDRNSASCQFYITKQQTRFLDGNYAIFGGVVQGMNTVFSIRPGDGILSAEIVSDGSAPPPQQQQVEETPPPTPQPRGRRGTGGSQTPAIQQGKPQDSGF
jgi:cyclophilin family peptidyl-prolyl cis-trans isomerase